MARTQFIKLTTTSTTGRVGPMLKTKPMRRVEAGASDAGHIWIDFLRVLEPQIQYAIDLAYRKEVPAVIQQMKSTVPVAPRHGGTLRDSIRAEYPRPQAVRLIAGGGRARYAYFIEFGFRHWITGRQMPAQPFFFATARMFARFVEREIARLVP